MLTTPELLINRTKEAILEEYKDAFEIVEKEMPKIKKSLILNGKSFTLILPCAFIPTALAPIKYMYEQAGWTQVNIENIYTKGSKLENLYRTRITFYRD